MATAHTKTVCVWFRKPKLCVCMERVKCVRVVHRQVQCTRSSCRFVHSRRLTEHLRLSYCLTHTHEHKYARVRAQSINKCRHFYFLCVAIETDATISQFHFHRTKLMILTCGWRHKENIDFPTEQCFHRLNYSIPSEMKFNFRNFYITRRDWLLWISCELKANQDRHTSTWWSFTLRHFRFQRKKNSKFIQILNRIDWMLTLRSAYCVLNIFSIKSKLKIDENGFGVFLISTATHKTSLDNDAMLTVQTIMHYWSSASESFQFDSSAGIFNVFLRRQCAYTTLYVLCMWVVCVCLRFWRVDLTV